MPWNQPDNGNPQNNNPWGGGNKNQGPPDLDKLISDLFKKMKKSLSFKNGSFKKSFSGRKWPIQMTPGNQSQPNTSKSNKDHHYGIGITLAALFILWLLSGFYIVNPAEQAVVLRLGHYSDVVSPGLHWMARFVDTKYLVDVQKIYSFSIDGDFLTKSSEQNDLANQYVSASTQSSNDQSKNLVNVELNVQYRINNPRAYLFNVVNPDTTIQEVAVGALSSVIGKMKLDDVLTTGREMLSAGVLEQVKHILQNYNPGIEVVSVTLRKVQAPDQVRRAFTDVNRADQDKATTIQQAQAYASKVIPLAQGFAARTRADANAYQQQVVLTAQANVARYQALFKAYTQAPEVTRTRLYLEAMQNVLNHSTKILVDNTNNNMIYLPLDKLWNQSTQTAEATPPTVPAASPPKLAEADTISLPMTVGGLKNVSN